MSSLSPSEIVAFIDEYGWHPDVPALQDSHDPLYIDRAQKDFIEKLLFRLDPLELDSLELTAADRLELEESIMLCRSAAADWAKDARSETKIAGKSGRARDNPVVVIRRILSGAQVAADDSPGGPSYERVFISHAAVDRRLAERLGEEIRTRLPGTDTFIASRPGDIPAGEWFKKVKDMLREADAYVAIITPTSKDRHWVIWEHGAAWMTGKKLITTRAGIQTKDVPEAFKVFQIHSLEKTETATEIFRELGDAGETLETFCQEIEAIVKSSPAGRQAPSPIEARWTGGKTSGWDQATRTLQIHLRGDGPVEITEIEAWMTHRDDPETQYAGEHNQTLPATLGTGQTSLEENVRFHTNDIPKALRGEQGTPQNMIILSAEVHYIDRDGNPGKRAAPDRVLT